MNIVDSSVIFLLIPSCLMSHIQEESNLLSNSKSDHLSERGHHTSYHFFLTAKDGIFRTLVHAFDAVVS